MSAAPPMPPESMPSPQPGLSEPARIINTFIAPSKTFEDLKRNASWWVPWLIISISLLISAVVIVQKVDMDQLMRHRIEQSKIAQRQMEQASPEQRERGIHLQVTINKVQFFLRPVFSLIFGLLSALVLMAIFNFGFGAEVPFQRALAIFFYARMPVVIVNTVLLCTSLLVSSDPGSIDPDLNPVATNPGFFMDRMSNKFLWGVASGLDVLAIWSVILLAIGFATASSNKKPAMGTAMIVMFVVYAVIVLISAVAGALF